MMVMLTMCFGTTAAFADDIISDEAEYEVIGIEAPINVSAKAMGSSSIRLSWDETEGADGYIVYTYKNGSYVKTKTVDSDVKYVLRNLDPGTKKTFKVTAYTKDVDGNIIESEMSEKASAATDRSPIEEFLATARTRLGCPYVSGGAGSRVFDCSGYVYWVVKNSDAVKVKMSRSSAQGEYAQVRKYDIGTTKLSAAKPGDIIFYGHGKSSIGHVGIYFGNGNQIHAFSTWGKVSISPVSMSTSNKRIVAIVRLPMK